MFILYCTNSIEPTYSLKIKDYFHNMKHCSYKKGRLQILYNNNNRYHFNLKRIKLISGDIYYTGELGNISVPIMNESIKKLYAELKKYIKENIIVNEGMYFIIFIPNKTKYWYYQSSFFGEIPVFETIFKNGYAISDFMKNLNFFFNGQGYLSHRNLVKYCAFGFWEGNSTIYKNIHRIKPGCYKLFGLDEIVFSKTAFEILKSKNFNNIKTDKNDLISSMNHLFVNSVKKRCSKKLKYNLLLSGGLDSRIIAGILKNNGFDFITTTYGVPNCWDMKIAKRISNHLSIDNFQLGFKPFLIKKFYKNFNKNNPYFIDNIQDINTYISLNHINNNMDNMTNISGLWGDPITGSHLPNYLKKITKQKDITNFLVKKHNLGISIDLLEKVLSKDFKAELRKRPKDIITNSILSSINQIKTGNYIKDCLLYDIFIRQPHWTSQFYYTIKSKETPVFPFADKEILKFVLNMQPEDLLYQNLYRKILTSKYPELDYFKWARNYIKPSNPSYAHYIADYFTNIQKIFYLISNKEHPSYIIPFQKWLKKDLHDWYFDTLNSHLNDNVIFNDKFIKDILKKNNIYSSIIIKPRAKLMVLSILIQLKQLNIDTSLTL